MKTKEIAELSVDELRGRKRELRHEIFNLRFQKQSVHLENPSLIRIMRLEAARVETFLSQKIKAGAAKS
jgi:large subunit ribosomal protein L29